VLQVDGTIQGIPFRYYGYYHSTDAGTVQVIGYTGQTMFEEYRREITEFLNGLELRRVR
jgi:hypothetical protein